MKEQKLTDENKNDKFRCDDCWKVMTRDEILKIWTSIPFCKEDKKTFYCGCNGWE